MFPEEDFSLDPPGDARLGMLLSAVSQAVTTKRGEAIDFTGYYNGAIWPRGWTEYKKTIGEWAKENANAVYYQWYDATTHLHIDWRNR